MDWKLKQKEGTVFSDLVALCGSSNCDKMWLTFCVTIYAKFISPVFGCKTLFWSEILSKVSLGKFFVVQAVERIILGQSFGKTMIIFVSLGISTSKNKNIDHQVKET